jgi:hypothetical protein
VLGGNEHNNEHTYVLEVLARECSLRALVQKSSVGGFQAAGGDTRPSRGGWQLRVGRVIQ